MLDTTITKEQGVFVVGRQLIDMALVASEAVEEYRKRKKKGFVMKFDFAKAYDHVD